MATKVKKAPNLVALTEPRKIDLQEEATKLGVDIVTDIASAQPANEAVFLGYQRRWFEDESQICIAEKSRRTGLTWAEAGRNVMTAAKPRRRGGRNVFYVGSKQEMALEYIAACALFARAFNQLAKADVWEQTFWDGDKNEEILTYMIRFPNSGFKIQALSSRPSNLRGLQGDVVIDEAAFHESLDELLKAAFALTMWGARVRIISTHNGVDNLFNQYIQDAREGRKDYSVHRITLDDAIADGLYRRICYVTGQEWTPEAEKAWRDGLYKNATSKEDADEEYGCIPKKGTATDSAITRYRPMIILADSKIDAQSATARALREQRRRLAKSVTFEAQLDGWTRSNGQIWMPNILAEIDASKFAIQTGPLLVSKVVLTLDDREGVKTTLTLAPRDGFLVPVEKDRKGKSSGSNASAGGIDALAEEYYRNHPEKRP